MGSRSPLPNLSQHFHRFPQFMQSTNTVIGSSALLVCFCVLVVLMLLHRPHVNSDAFSKSPLMPHMSLIFFSFALSQSNLRESGGKGRSVIFQ